MNEKERRREVFWNIAVSGANLGVILFAGGLLGLWALSGREEMEFITSRLGVVFFLYLLAGCFFRLVKSLPELDYTWLRGITVVYWFDILLFLLMIAAAFLPDYLRYMILADAAVLFVRWIINYVYMKHVADQLNHRAGGGRTLVIDLNEKPGTKEEFFGILEEYCVKNRLDLEYVERDIPALVKLDGIPHKVDLNSYFTYGGAVYTMDISKAGTKYAGKSK